MSAPAEPLSGPALHCVRHRSGDRRQALPVVRHCTTGGTRPGSLGRRGLWMLGVVMLAVYGVVLLIVAAAR